MGCVRQPISHTMNFEQRFDRIVEIFYDYIYDRSNDDDMQMLRDLLADKEIGWSRFEALSKIKQAVEEKIKSNKVDRGDYSYE